MTTFNTCSESCFYQICESLGYEAEKIERAQQKTPDFSVICNGIEIIAEVKELSANPNSKELSKKIQKNRSYTCELDTKYNKHINKMLKKAKKQLSKVCDDGTPTLSVIYTTMKRRITPDDFQIDAVLRHAVLRKGEVSISSKKDEFSIPPEISAIMVMKNPNGELKYHIYRNHKARITWPDNIFP